MHPTNPEPAPKRDYEDKDIPIRSILGFGIFTAVFTVLSLVGGKLMFHALASRNAAREAAPSKFAAERVLPPTNQLLLVNEPASWKDQLAWETSGITGYAWVDREKGVVRIPVERAIDLLAERGLPARNGGKTPQP
jgi:hypothetical protein